MKVVLCAIPVMPKGKRVAEHQPGYGDQAGNGKGLNAGGRAFLEAGESTCQSNTDVNLLKCSEKQTENITFYGKCPREGAVTGKNQVRGKTRLTLQDTK
jgi:hypothetical protein